MSERPSRLQTDLEAAIRTEGNPHDADCLRADLAVQLARSGRVAEAEAIVAELRVRYRTSAHARVTPWINFAECHIELAHGNGDAALEKMRRAHALASASSLLPFVAFAAASLAYFYWNREEVEQGVRYAREALERAGPDDHRTRCRVSLVVGEMLAMSRLAEDAKAWFVRARRHAMLARDDVAISALAFNLALIHSALATQAMLQGRLFDLHARSADIAARSSAAFDEIIQLPESDMNVIRRAHSFSFSGEYAKALAIYEARLRDIKLSSASRRRCYWLADTAWCLINLNRPDEARPLAIEAAGAMTPETQIDDRAATHSRLALVFAALGDKDTAAKHQASADDRWGQYRAFQDRCAALCEPCRQYAGDCCAGDRRVRTRPC